jgi:GAF domain-containing protein
MLSREALLTEAIVQVVDTLVEDFDLVDVLTTLTTRCTEILGADAAGIMLTEPGGDLRVMASSSETMRVLEVLEVQANEGPCLDAFRTGQHVTRYELNADEDRWPTFAPAALAAGFAAVQAFPMTLRGVTLGALNLFSGRSDPLDHHDIVAAKALADIATIAVLQHRATLQAQELNDQLQSALSSRVVIEQAKGVVAERLNLDMEEAFFSLRNYARNTNLRLADVAGAIVSRTLSPSAL